MYFTIRCDAVPGRLLELDTWLKDRAVQFWTKQPGVKSFEIFSDALVGYPERTMLIEVENFDTLQKILTSVEHGRFRNELLTYGTDVQSQILDRLILKQ